MNDKVTKKYVRQNYSRIIAVPYCELYHVLNPFRRFGHTEREEGWGADCYYVDFNTAIVTGYAPFGNYTAKYELCKKYENLAKEVYERETDWHIISDTCRQLMKDFAKEVCGDE